MINLDRTNSPIPILISPITFYNMEGKNSHVGKSTRIIRNILITSRCKTTTNRIRSPNCPTPLTTECSIEDNVMIFEMIIDVTTTLEVGCWGSPCGRVRSTICDVGGDGTRGEEPDANKIGCPLSRIDTAVIGVESGTVGSSGCFEDTAA